MAKRTRPKITLKSDAPDLVSKQEALVQKLQSEKKNEETPAVTKKKKLRFTMDLPIELHEEISEKLEETGQTMKGYFLSLAKKDLRNSKGFN